MLRAILFPGSHLFVTTGGKEQAASITLAKVEELCRLLPFLNNEINWERGVSKKSKDNPYRDYYIWREGKGKKPPNNWASNFVGPAWEYDETTNEYYRKVMKYYKKKGAD